MIVFNASTGKKLHNVLLCDCTKHTSQLGVMGIEDSESESTWKWSAFVNCKPFTQLITTMQLPWSPWTCKSNPLVSVLKLFNTSKVPRKTVTWHIVQFFMGRIRFWLSGYGLQFVLQCHFLHQILHWCNVMAAPKNLMLWQKFNSKASISQVCLKANRTFSVRTLLLGPSWCAHSRSKGTSF